MVELIPKRNKTRRLSHRSADADPAILPAIFRRSSRPLAFRLSVPAVQESKFEAAGRLSSGVDFLVFLQFWRTRSPLKRLDPIIRGERSMSIGR